MAATALYSVIMVLLFSLWFSLSLFVWQWQEARVHLLVPDITFDIINCVVIDIEATLPK